MFYVETLNDDFTKIADSIRMWGRITGGVAPAEELADDFERRVETVKETMASYESGMSVFQDLGDLWTPGDDTLIAEVFELLKLSNIAHDVSGYVQMSPEVIVERNPQIVIALFGETIDANPVFSNVRAVKNERIFVPASADALSVAGRDTSMASRNWRNGCTRVYSDNPGVACFGEAAKF